ncbi:MAG: hypothetical protein LUC92_03955 [Clostridiales bacterium]|nr:hypothetical protein [Clostridiales bacterium]
MNRNDFSDDYTDILSHPAAGIYWNDCNFAVRPTYDVQLMLYGGNKETIEALTRYFLNCSSELSCYSVKENVYIKQ